MGAKKIKTMARFKITRDETGKHTWKATGTNPATGKTTVIRGGQTGTLVGKNNPRSEKSFDARHEATGMTPKKFVNRLRWDNRAKLNSFISIPDKLFRKAKGK